MESTAESTAEPDSTTNPCPTGAGGLVWFRPRTHNMCTRSGTKPGRKVEVEGRKEEGDGDQKNQEGQEENQEEKKKNNKRRRKKQGEPVAGAGLRGQQKAGSATERGCKRSVEEGPAGSKDRPIVRRDPRGLTGASMTESASAVGEHSGLKQTGRAA